MSWEQNSYRESASAQHMYESGYASEAERLHPEPIYQSHVPPMNQTMRDLPPSHEPPRSAFDGPQVMQPLPPPTGQQGYVFYGWQPVFMKVGESSGSRFAAVLSYLGGWFSGLLLLFFGFENKYVRFHALQSLLFFGFLNIADFFMFVFGGFGLRIWSHVPFAHGFFALGIILAFLLINVVAFVGWLLCIAMAASGKYYKIPIFGHFAARLSGVEPSSVPTVK